MQIQETRINIPIELSEEIELLFSRYNGYLAILEYLAQAGSLDEKNKFFDKKWDEAVEIYMKLEAKKAVANNTYCPGSNFKNYRFDFINHQMVYTE